MGGVSAGMMAQINVDRKGGGHRDISIEQLYWIESKWSEYLNLGL